ncbi:pancreatic lipase-related protein 2-like isoform X2 [Leptopilina boulardi]|uniref:pancreatic lipase-related protein 2-like isoform X2 n=1 Tax=Leptopilina boulardi TaxID=63433 RepID=UPI0021F61B24|nr:pancreatic lipase-related protein 2-like isoform X2 [Leptopilina boulardi]
MRLFIVILMFSASFIIIRAENILANLQPDSSQDTSLEQAIVNVLINPSVLIPDDRGILSGVLDPIVVPEKDIIFQLFTKTNSDEAYMMNLNDSENLKQSGFNSSLLTKIIIHGWTDSSQTPWLREIRTNYLNTGDYNVILINWLAGSVKEYSAAAKVTRQVGGYLAEFLEFLQKEVDLDLNTVHILGHSLGAHVAGFAGANLSGKIGRITGMDPAGPGFERPRFKEPKDRLDASDAVFVDVIHTCGGTIGFAKSIGHADFFPNGGTFRQPGCPILMTQYCSHARSHQFMSESIVSPEIFVSVECDSWKDFKSGTCNSKNSPVFMGEKLSYDTRGTYFLETNSESPFGKGTIRL